MIWPFTLQTTSEATVATCEIDDDIVLVTMHDPVEELRQLYLSIDELISVRGIILPHQPKITQFSAV